MAAWRLARSLDTLRSEVNQRWPRRSKVSDGTIGTAAAIGDVDWPMVGSTSAVAALLSLLTSVATGLPEAD